MSRHWSSIEYINSQSIWEFVDFQITKLEMQQEEGFVSSSESCKLILFGKKEMLDAFSTFIHEHSKRLKEIVNDCNIPITEDTEDGLLD